MELRIKNNLIILLIISIFLIPGVLGATASISQSGADSGTVMKGEAFTLTVSGLSGSGTATLSLPSGFSSSEESTKSFSGSSVSWTTLVANEKLTSQTISVLISIAGSPTTATTSSFNVVLPPSFTLTASPSSKTVSVGESFDISLNVQNTGETTAQSVIATMTLPSGLTTSSATKTIGTINGGSGGSGESASVSWTVTASNPSASSSITISATSSNTDTETVTITITGPSSGDNAGTTGGGGAAAITGKTYTLTEAQFSAGATNSLKSGDGFKFTINNENHTLKLVSFTQTTATVIASSTPQTATLNIGEEKKFELTGDNFYDLSVKLNSINSTAKKAEFTVKEINEQISAGETQDAGETSKEPETTPGQGTGEPADNKTGEIVKGNNAYAWIIAVIIVIIILVYIIWVKKHKI